MSGGGILAILSKIYRDIWNEGSERKTEVKDNSKVLTLNDGKYRVPVYYDREDYRKAGLRNIGIRFGTC